MSGGQNNTMMPPVGTPQMAAGQMITGSGNPANYTGQNTAGYSKMKQVPQVALQTSGFGGMGYTPTPQTFTPSAKPGWMQGVWDMPGWGMSAATGQPLTQGDLQPQGVAAGAQAPMAPNLPGKGRQDIESALVDTGMIGSAPAWASTGNQILGQPIIGADGQRYYSRAALDNFDRLTSGGGG